MRELREQVAGLEDQRAQLADAATQPERPSLGEIDRLADELARALSHEEPPRIKEVLRGVIDHIAVESRESIRPVIRVPLVRIQGDRVEWLRCNTSEGSAPSDWRWRSTRGTEKTEASSPPRSRTTDPFRSSRSCCWDSQRSGSCWSVSVTAGLGIAALAGIVASGAVAGLRGVGWTGSVLAALAFLTSFGLDAALFFLSYRVLTAGSGPSFRPVARRSVRRCGLDNTEGRRRLVRGAHGHQCFGGLRDVRRRGGCAGAPASRLAPLLVRSRAERPRDRGTPLRDQAANATP